MNLTTDENGGLTGATFSFKPGIVNMPAFTVDGGYYQGQGYVLGNFWKSIGL